MGYRENDIVAELISAEPVEGMHSMVIPAHINLVTNLVTLRLNYRLIFANGDEVRIDESVGLGIYSRGETSFTINKTADIIRKMDYFKLCEYYEGQEKLEETKE